MINFWMQSHERTILLLPNKASKKKEVEMEKKTWIDPKLVEVGKVAEAAAPSIA